MTVEELIAVLFNYPLDKEVFVVFDQQEPVSGLRAEVPTVVGSEFEAVYITADYEANTVRLCDHTGRGWA